MLMAVMGMATILGSQAALGFDLQGHRGARGLSPENTLPGFARALSLGVTTLEMDTGITRDGFVVIAHDPTLNPDITRDKHGNWLDRRGPTIRSLTLAELRQYDVGRIKPGTDYAKRYPEQAPIDGTRIPTLADLCALVKKSGNERVRLNIETKISPLEPGTTPDPDTFARMLIDVIREEGMAARATIQSFDWRTLQVVQRVAPQIRTVYLSAQQRFLDNIGADNRAVSPWTAGFHYRDHGSVPRMVVAAGGRIWSPFFGDVSAPTLQEARDLGLKVIVWTVNDPAQIRRMLDLGVDGIISDRPDVVRQALADRGMPLPPPSPVTP
jgi:glycerophosphoryl diester phosphodiesterase